MTTKFAAHSLGQLMMASGRAAGRVARKAKIVVAVEVDDGSWCELDADSEAHAEVLARNWVDVLGARGCSCWHVIEDGSYAARNFFTYYEQPKFT